MKRLQLFFLAILLMASSAAVADTAVIQGADADSWFMGYGDKNTNHGTHPLLYTGHVDGTGTHELFGKRSLMKFGFDEISLAPEEIVLVNSAKLYMWNVAQAGAYSGDVSMDIHIAGKAWVESEVTMMNATASTPWTNPGGDLGAGLATMVADPAVSSVWNYWQSAALAAAVENWINNPSSNTGVIAKHAGDSIQDIGGGPGVHCPPGQGFRWNLTFDLNPYPLPADVAAALGTSTGLAIPTLLLDYTIIPEPATFVILSLGSAVLLRRKK